MPFTDPMMDAQLPPELAGQAQQLRMREQIMQAMMNGSMTPPEVPETKGRLQGRVSPFSILASAAKGAGAAYGMNQSANARADLANQYREGVTNAMTQYQQTKAGVPEAAPAEGAEGPTRPGVAADPRKAVIDAMTSPYPQVQSVGKLDYAQMAKADQPYTLARGAERRGPDGKIIAQNDSASPTDIPMTVKEWEYYQKLPPANQKAFLEMKRSPQFLDLGNGFVPRPQNLPVSPAPTVSPMPSAAPVAPGPALPVAPSLTPPPATSGGLIPKGIPPAQTAEHKGEVAAAVATGTAQAKRDFNMNDLGSIITEANSVLTGNVKPTHSTVGSLADSAAAVVGATPRGAAEADQLRAIGGALVAKMPRMEGPQSDYDVKNYKEMAGQVGNDKLPLDRRLAALETIKKIWLKYDKSAGASPSGAPSVDDLLKKYGGQ